MKNIRKCLCLVFVFVLILVPVNALEDEIITITVGDVDVPVYRVDTVWDSMEFTYNEQINYEWNNTNHTYDLSAPTYSWFSNSNSVNITNNSSSSINVSLNYNSIVSDVLGSFDISSADIGSGQSHISKLTLSGSLNDSNVNYTKVGFIDLVIS
ncbi:MAG: hypothetical protein IJO43_02120 [Bacilli bacterium]|nr:hypothetical protein [Bacilli bacterium]